MKTAIHYLIVFMLGISTIYFLFILPESGSENFCLKLFGSKIIAFILGYIGSELAIKWELIDTSERV